MFDIEVLRIIWWLLIGFLIIGFAILDGFDFGVACLLPFVTRNDAERIVLLNTIRPFWEGNQVWIILGAGAIFAAWPYVYAVAFSGTYFAMLLLLLTMGISRPVSFKYRDKIKNPYWRKAWDRVVFIGGFVPSLIFGIMMGNLLLGLPFYFDNELRIFYKGTFFALFQPFALFCGLTSLFMLVMHGGLYLAIKTDNPIRLRAQRAVRIASIFFIVLFIIGGGWSSRLMGYQVVSDVNTHGISNPLNKTVMQWVGAWMMNYHYYPLLLGVPLLAILSALGVFILVRFEKLRFCFILSSICITCVIATVGISMFPFLLPSSIHLTSSLLIWDASSSYLTLLMMLAAVIFFMPIILLYTTWVYRVLRGKVKEVNVRADEVEMAKQQGEV